MKKNIIGLSACLSLSICLAASTASAQDIVTTPPARVHVPTCNELGRTMLASMVTNPEGRRTVTYRVPTTEELNAFQHACHRGELILPAAYDRWLRASTGEGDAAEQNADADVLDVVNMLMTRRARITCSARWGCQQVNGRPTCRENFIPVRVGNEMGCAASEEGARYIAREIVDERLRGLCVPSAGQSVNDACAELRHQIDTDHSTLDDVNRRFTDFWDVILPNLRTEHNAMRDTYCPPIASEPDATPERRCQVEHARLGNPELASVPADLTRTQNRVGNVEAVVNRRGWRGGGQLSLLIPTGDAAPYVSFGPSLGHVWGHVSDDGAVWLAHGSVGVTGAPNVGGGAAADGAVGVGYHVGIVTIAGTLLGGGMWTPSGDTRFRGTSLSWFAGAGLEVHVDLTERLRFRGSFGVAGGQTTQVNDQGIAGRVGGPYLPATIALEGAW